MENLYKFGSIRITCIIRFNKYKYNIRAQTTFCKNLGKQKLRET